LQEKKDRKIKGGLLSQKDLRSDLWNLMKERKLALVPCKRWMEFILGNSGDSYHSLNGGESLEMEREDMVETEPIDRDEEDVVVISRWQEQEERLVPCFATHQEDKITTLTNKHCYRCQKRPSKSKSPR
ncbi:hypothetical protein CHS0354_016585, partial [Potamilus streckersoni]